MNEQTVANGFRQVSDVNLRALYVIVKKLHAGHVMASKVTDLVSGEQRLYKKIQRDIEAYTAVADAQVQLGLLLEMAQQLKLPKVPLTDDKIVLLQVQAMIEQLYVKYETHDKLAPMLAGHVKPLDAILAIHATQLQRFFTSALKKLTGEEREQVYEALSSYIEDDTLITLNDDVITQVLQAHAPTDYCKQIEVTAILIEALPNVKLEESLDRVLAIFIHPSFLKFDVFGTTAFSLSKQLDNTRTLFLGLALTVLTVIGARYEKADIHVLAAHWQHVVNQRAKLQLDIDALRNHIGQHEALLLQFGAQLDAKEEEIQKAAYYVRQEKEKLYADFNVTRADMEITDTTYHTYYKRFKEAEREVAALREKNENGQSQRSNSIFSKLTSKVKATANNVSIKSKEREKKKLYEGMIDLFIDLDSRYLASEKAVIRQLQANVDALNEEKAVIEGERAPILAAMRDLQQKINDKEKNIAHMEKLFYSIDVGTPKELTAPRPLPAIETEMIDLENIEIMDKDV
ncbi:hypothetical protein [Caryophanon latum]|uniref:Uncharacterized protein n=1 Tax=Caryophanon latum TaxID=33977 RepID=A0A1C0YAM9_9BACL|nr:hypothetical protein [Caryophanon latum]OCS84189.1 hypothetical protein A6K76_16060 [Caryophanon latum]